MHITTPKLNITFSVNKLPFFFLDIKFTKDNTLDNTFFISLLLFRCS